MADNEFDAWVENALGFRFQGAAGSGPEALGVAIAAWHDASDAVDGQIGSLQAALRNSDDEELR